ncbi:hypothetical protein ACFL20_02635 [Spirochaetota bacterium]
MRNILYSLMAIIILFSFSRCSNLLHDAVGESLSEGDLYSAIEFTMDVSNLNGSIYTEIGNSTLEGTPTEFPNGRSEKFRYLDGDDYLTFDMSTISLDQGIISIWLKPDFGSFSTSTFFVLDSQRLENDGIKIWFSSTHFKSILNINDTKEVNADEYDTDFTWEAGAVLHIVLIWNNPQDSYDESFFLYVNNGDREAADRGGWTGYLADKFSSETTIGSSGTSNNWLGGIFDFTIFNYNALSKFSRTQILQALYNNEFGSNGEHKFCYELEE